MACCRNAKSGECCAVIPVRHGDSLRALAETLSFRNVFRHYSNRHSRLRGNDGSVASFTIDLPPDSRLRGNDGTDVSFAIALSLNARRRGNDHKKIKKTLQKSPPALGIRGVHFVINYLSNKNMINKIKQIP